ncbi:MAG TPA: hypothetical protein ENH23_03745 [candidate division Zixibacteria bacterium]|nr:hypothetical protein [candidate division Zixibacteria bacterium]
MKVKLLIAVMIFAVSSFCVAEENTAGIDTTATAVDSIRLPAPPLNLTGKDKPNDHGHAVVLNWDLSADDGAGANSVLRYDIYRWVPQLMLDLDLVRDSISVIQKILRHTTNGIKEGSQTDSMKNIFSVKTRDELFDIRNKLIKYVKKENKGLAEASKSYPSGGAWLYVDKKPSGTKTFVHIGSKEPTSSSFVPDFANLYYRVYAVTVKGARSSSQILGPIQSSGQWFNTYRIPVAYSVVIFTFLTIYYVRKAKKGADLYVRPLGGIEAVDDAIGRATEMGRPILYVLGLGSAADIATIASFTILGRVAKKVAEYQTELLVPTYDPIVMTVAQEVVKSAYLDAGRPDAYKEDTVHFVTQSQFAYVAAVNGIMLRELPATNVYMGKFFAESLILAETGALAGSIQISGTDEIAQIPFFIVACDYTLIGEELYAASAYLGKEPVLLGSLKAQDYAKAVIIVLAVIGVILAQFDFGHYFVKLFEVAN